MENPAPETADEMVARWAQRDAEYAKRRIAMDAAEAEAIRAGRRREAGMLPVVGDRARMWARADTWQPPHHDEFGSIKDWLDG